MRPVVSTACACTLGCYRAHVPSNRRRKRHVRDTVDCCERLLFLRAILPPPPLPQLTRLLFISRVRAEAR